MWKRRGRFCKNAKLNFQNLRPVFPFVSYFIEYTVQDTEFMHLSLHVTQDVARKRNTLELFFRKVTSILFVLCACRPFYVLLLLIFGALFTFATRDDGWWRSASLFLLWNWYDQHSANTVWWPVFVSAERRLDTRRWENEEKHWKFF